MWRGGSSPEGLRISGECRSGIVPVLFFKPPAASSSARPGTNAAPTRHASDEDREIPTQDAQISISDETEKERKGEDNTGSSKPRTESREDDVPGQDVRMSSSVIAKGDIVLDGL
jgi:hypothetical protein